MFGLGKKRVDPQQAADDFIAHMFGVANQTYDQWHQALAVTTAKATNVDHQWLADFLTHQHEKRALNFQYAAAILAQEAAGIRVALEPKAANAVMGALHRGLSTGSEGDWFPATVFRHIEAEAQRTSMYDHPVVTGLLADMGYQDEPKLAPMVGHMVWTLPLAEALLNASQAYWKTFVTKAQIKV